MYTSTGPVNIFLGLMVRTVGGLSEISLILFKKKEEVQSVSFEVLY